MIAIRQPEPENIIWLAASAALLIHLAALVGLEFLPGWTSPTPQPIRDISVELVPPPPAPEQKARPAPVAPALAEPEDTIPVDRVPTGPPPASPGLIRARQLYAAAALAEPESRRARTRLRMLVQDDRVIQLCNLEAMEQVARWDTALRPDHVVAYARQETRFSGGWLEADGAAIHSGSSWFKMEYRCQAGADLESVAGFEFRFGKEIPYRDWSRYNLPSHVDPHD
jgi:hypothetical protein